MNFPFSKKLTASLGICFLAACGSGDAENSEETVPSNVDGGAPSVGPSQDGESRLKLVGDGGAPSTIVVTPPSSGGAGGGPTAKPPAPLQFPPQDVRISAGVDMTCGLNKAGEAKCWGRNDRGQLGQGTTANIGDEPSELAQRYAPIRLGAGRKVQSLTAGWYHACALLDNGSAKCWGFNDVGQLGQGDNLNRGDKPGQMGDALRPVSFDQKIVAIASGGYHNCALLESGDVKCWGSNTFGQLGVGDVEHRGDQPGEMGASLPSVNLGTGKRAIGIATGNFHSCALLEEGAVKCWGNGVDGQLGLGVITRLGEGPGEMGDKLPTVDLGKGRRAVSLSLGGFHSCAVLDDGSAKCWGMNDVGQLGQGDSQNRGNAAGQMGDALRPIDVGPGRTVKRIATQYDHVCALLDDGGLRCWGWNNGGQLGLGDTNDRGSQRNQLGNGLPKVALGVTSPIAQVGVGFDHSCVLFDNDRFKCWGINGGGQLGVGNRSRYGDRAGTMGATLPFVQF